MAAALITTLTALAPSVALARFLIKHKVIVRSQVAEKVGGKQPALLIVPKMCGGTQYTSSFSALLTDQEV